jgi:hypothetical protein
MLADAGPLLSTLDAALDLWQIALVAYYGLKTG